MRKLLSFVIVAMMIVSMIVPVFALSEAPTATAENHINIWVEDAELDLDETTTVDVYVSINDNEDGFEYMKFYLVYPSCLTYVSMEAVDFAEDLDGLTNADSATEHETLDQQFVDSLDEAGYEEGYDPLENGKYKWVAALFDFELKEKINGKNVAVDCFENGQILKVTFEYDASANTEFGSTLPIKLFDAPENQLHCYRKDYEWSDELYDVTVSDGVVTLKTTAHVHKPGEAVEENVVPATCTEAGSYDLVVYCTECGEELSREEGKVIEAKGHSLGDAYVYQEATPEADGILRRECANCDYYEDEPIKYVACEHDISAVFAAPTADEDGSIVYTCSKCDFEETIELPAYGEFGVAFEDITVNEGERGEAKLSLKNTEYGIDVLRVLVYWDESDEYVAEIENGELFAEDGFAYAYLSEEEAAKLIAEAGIDFDVDGKDFAILYFEIADDSFEPVCEDGVLATFTFEDPGEAAEFNYGVINIDEPSVTFVDEYDKFLGFIDYAMADVAEATATIHYHTPADAVEDPDTRIEPSCEVKGSHDMVVYCSECGAELSRENVDIPATGHTPGEAVVENRVESTCTKAGSYNSVVYCSVCEKKLSTEKINLPLAEHTKGQTVTIVKAPTADEKGTIRYACSVCGNFIEEFDEEIDETGVLAFALEGGIYNAGDTIEIPVTLTNGNYGVDAVRFLVYWDEAFGTPEFVLSDEVFNGEDDALESAVIDADAAEKLLADAGLATVEVVTEDRAYAVVYIAVGDEDFTVRTGDGKLATVTFTGPEGGGDFTVGIVNIENPNVTYYGEDGSFAGFIDYEVEGIAPTAEITVHDYEVVVTPPTCTEGGYTTHTCAHCGDEYVTDRLDALGHTPEDEWEVTEATIDADGAKILRCSVCGEILDKVVLPRKVIDLKVTVSSMIIAEDSYPEGTVLVDNDTRVINLIAKKDQVKAVFRLKLDGVGNDAFTLDEAAFEAGNAIKIGTKIYTKDTDAAGIRYFICYAEGGFNQSFKVLVTDADGNVYDYTVNVTFMHTPAVTDDSLVMGYKGARSSSLDVDAKLIRIESKDAQTSMSFNLKRVKGVTLRVDPNSANMPTVLQYAGVDNNNKAIYAEIDPTDDNAYNDDSIVYFKVVRSGEAAETQEFDIVLTYYNGQTETYHVEAIFN
ncbi:MAG: hypothetical protein IJS45_03280 [Clostridia bacterium]|nr:hypothetical protein [Clostridia bacterium]